MIKKNDNVNFSLYVTIAILCLALFVVTFTLRTTDEHSKFDVPSQTLTSKTEALKRYIEKKSHPDFLGSENLESAKAAYPDFSDLLISADIPIPESENFVFQGVTTVKNDYIVMTAYDYTKKENSRCYVLSSKGRLVNVVDLGNNSHVGGIAYDETNDLFWIPTSKGTLAAYDLDDILNQEKASFKFVYSEPGKGLFNYRATHENSIDFLTVDDGHIFVGNFALDKKGIVKQYKISRVGEKIVLTYESKYDVPPKTQGITFVTKEEKKYLLVSTSYGRHRHSKLMIFAFDSNRKDYTSKNATTYFLPPLLEQITSKDEELYLIFESGAKKFADCPYKISVLCIFDLKKMI